MCMLVLQGEIRQLVIDAIPCSNKLFLTLYRSFLLLLQLQTIQLHQVVTCGTPNGREPSEPVWIQPTHGVSLLRDRTGFRPHSAAVQMLWGCREGLRDVHHDGIWSTVTPGVTRCESSKLFL